MPGTKIVGVTIDYGNSINQQKSYIDDEKNYYRVGG